MIFKFNTNFSKLSFSKLILIIGFLVVGCQSEIKIHDNTVFRYNEFRNITSLDPAFARNPQNIWPIQQIFNGLVQLDDSLQIRPEIAKSWHINEEGTVYTFELRDDVYFHKSNVFGPKGTRTVTAEDFVYSFNRLKDEKTGSPGGWVLQNVKNYYAPNTHVLQIELKQPFPAFLGLLTMRYCAVVPKEGITFFKDDFRSNPIGTGPFQFKKWEEDVKLVLRKNDLYFEQNESGEQLPYLEAIAISFLPDIQSEFMMFIQGKFDFLNSLDTSYKDDLLTPLGELQEKHHQDIKMEKGPYLNTEYIGFYLDANNKALKSRKIRKAMNIGFDREKMILFLRNTIGFPAFQGFIPKGLPGHGNQIFNEYNPALAQELVQEYTKEQGENPKIRLATDVNYLDICEYLQRAYQNIGIDVTIELMPTATLRQAKSSGNLEAFRASWIADYPDAENYLSLFYSKNFSPKGPNYTHFSQAKFDKLYEETMKISDPEKRIVSYRKMDRLLMSSYPIIPLYYDQAIRFTRKNIIGLQMNAINLLNLKHVQKN
ncbi:MAG: ABC transporter substrate-binding protein [Flavobacteriaceae bacterium]